mgnify:CR=1 FL=1
MLKKDMVKRKKAFEKRLIGLTYAKIGMELGVSRQRVQQWLSPPSVIRNSVHIRAGGQCDECGIELNKGGHVHYIGGDDYNIASNPSPHIRNLQWLCGTCHRRKHRGLNTYPAILQIFNRSQLKEMQSERGLTDKEFLEFIRIDEYTWNSYIKEKEGGNYAISNQDTQGEAS